VVGGVASVAGGGKFANGAITGAFGYLFNQRGGRRIETEPERPLEEEIREELNPNIRGGLDYTPGPEQEPQDKCSFTDTRGGVYVLTDPESGEVMRSGRTIDFDRREGEHGRDPLLENLTFDRRYNTDDYATQRGLEQAVHDAYQPPLNRINPISPNNLNRPGYMNAAKSFLDQ
jgi:hypothetical protein